MRRNEGTKRLPASVEIRIRKLRKKDAFLSPESKKMHDFACNRLTGRGWKKVKQER